MFARNNKVPRSCSRTRTVDASSHTPFVDPAADLPDCISLDPLNEDSLLANLLSRFKRDHIYTYIGNILLSINPYKPLAQYTEQAIADYKLRTVAISQLPPHVFAVADHAWRSLRDFYSDQVIVITGESGSGKTEASKLILQYLGFATGKSNELETVRQQLLLCNPVLEAFGNAKSIHNDNSSRFGKYIELEFDYRGEPVGGLITHYLLEKSRVTTQHHGERNFHIFFQLLAGADVQLLKSLKLQRNTDNYLYLRNNHSNPSVWHQSDKEEFLNTKKALETVGFSAEDIVNIFRIVAAVLKLGNLIFTPVSNIDGTEGCSINNEYELEEVATLLMISIDELRSALLYRTYSVSCSGMDPHGMGGVSGGNCFSRDSTLPSANSRTYIGNNHQQHQQMLLQQQRTSLLSTSASMVGASMVGRDMYQMMDGCHGSEVGLQVALGSRVYQDAKDDFVMTDLSAAEATTGRDALCKALYYRLFTWIINSINDRIKVKQHGKRRILSILDIYGFENLPTNGFEQLIINYCNEKLQHFVTEIIVKEEQEVYMQEGLEWSPILFPDNVAVCDLIEKHNLGLLAIMDEECQRPCNGSEDAFLNKVGQVFQDNTQVEVAWGLPSKSSDSTTVNAFRLKHYAGWVTYSVNGFLEKNSDLLVRGLSQSMYQCSHPIVKELFPEGNPRRTTLRRPATSGTQFKVAIIALMRSLRSKNPHFVRCIKPNAFKQPHHFDVQTIQNQLRYLGLLESTQVKRNGYAFRQPYAWFLQRYKMLSTVTWPHWGGVAIEGVARLLRDLPISATEYAFGRRMLFIKNDSTLMQLEDFRRIRLDDLATLIQKTFRAWATRWLFLKRRQSQIKIATAWRRYKARREYLELRQRRRMIEAVLVIERSYIQWKRKRYLNRLAIRLPSTSPTCREWPTVTLFLRDTNQILKKLYHVWRCHRYRMGFDQIGRNRMREKVTASLLFKNRKESYARSVAHPFQGDYVRLRQNSQWRKLVNETSDQYIVFADIVSKITRSSGRLVPVLFVVSTSSMMILDQRTLNIKYRVPAADIVRISLSPFLDDIAVFHVKSFHDCTSPSVPNLQTGCLHFQQSSESSVLSPSFGNKWKGDLVLQTCHVIELVTKMFLVVQNAAGKAPEVNVHTDFELSLGHQAVEFSFHCTGPTEVQPGHVRIVRRGYRLEVTL
uniref:Uncharacterized protein n=1 Tax=Daphnia galeata TaxID=27404 RepID=A0A8J2RCF5_9CRUS|nr:unnamed protein product [Daphnia galeata]